MKSIIKYNSTDGKWELIDQEAGSTPISTAVGSPYANPWDLKWSSDIGISCGDTVDATAIASDIAKGKTAYVNGEKIVGTKEDASISVEGLTARAGDVLAGVTFIGADGTTQMGAIQVTPQKSVSFNDLTSNGGKVTVEVGGYVDEVVITGITMPTASQIAYNQTVLGVTGTFTYGATATASDIMKGKTAYVNGNMVTGTRTEATGGGGVSAGANDVLLILEDRSVDSGEWMNVGILMPDHTAEKYGERRVWVGTVESLGSTHTCQIVYDNNYLKWAIKIDGATVGIANNRGSGTDPWDNSGSSLYSNTGSTGYSVDDVTVRAIQSFSYIDIAGPDLS